MWQLLIAEARFEARVLLLVLLVNVPAVEEVHPFVPSVPAVTLPQLKLLAVAEAVGLDPGFEAALHAAHDAQCARTDTLDSSSSPSPTRIRSLLPYARGRLWATITTHRGSGDRG